MAALLEKTRDKVRGNWTSLHSQESTRLRRAMEKAKEIRLAHDKGAITRAQADAALAEVRQGRR